MNIVEALETKRYKARLTQGAFARRLGVSDAEYSKVINGKHKPGPSLVLRALMVYPDLRKYVKELQHKEGVAL